MLMPVLLTGVDGPEGWISVLIAALILFFAIKAVNKAMKTYDEDTIISVSDKVFPKFISKLIGIYYIFMFLTVNSLIMKDFAEQVKLMMMFRTPLSTVIVAILLTAAYAAKKRHTHNCQYYKYSSSNILDSIFADNYFFNLLCGLFEYFPRIPARYGRNFEVRTQCCLKFFWIFSAFVFKLQGIGQGKKPKN